MTADIIAISAAPRRAQDVPERHDEISQMWIDRLPLEILSITRALRSRNRSEFDGATSPANHVTLADVAFAANYLADLATHATWQIAGAKQRAEGRKNRRRSIPDAERPWDFRDEGLGTVSEGVDRKLEEARLLLLQNEPRRAVAALEWAAYLIKAGMKRAEEIEARAARAKREAQRRARERAAIEAEERRLARERVRARRIAEKEVAQG
jgi:hypothetical protein